jgi:hypothetical protein
VSVVWNFFFKVYDRKGVQARMTKNAFKITRIAPGVSFNGYRQLQLKYDVEDGVVKKIKTLMGFL